MKRSDNKINKVLIVIIIILSLCVVGLGALVATTLLAKTNHPNNVADKEIVEKEIKDIDIITELSTKIDKVLSDTDNQYHQSISTTAYKYRYIVLKQSLSDLVKQWIILDNISWNNIPESEYETTKNTSFMKELIKAGYQDSYMLKTTKQVALDVVSVESEKLFGEKIISPVKNIYKCPSYWYEESTKMYYFPEPQCGGLNPNLVVTYKSNYEEVKDEAHVYVSVGHLATEGTYSMLEKYTVYKDFDFVGDPNNGNIMYKDEYKSGLDQASAEAFKIDSSNYQDFSEFKFIFKKDKTSNYYLSKVEQTK